MSAAADANLLREHDDLVQLNATMIAQQYRGLHGVERDDLLSFGRMGLIHARDSFDRSRDLPFRRWANWRIQTAMIDGLRSLGVMSRKGKRRRPVPIECDLDAMVDAGPSPEDAVIELEASTRLRTRVIELPTSERTMLERVYFADDTIVEAAASIGLSKSWGSRLHARALGLLAEQMGGVS